MAYPKTLANLSLALLSVVVTSLVWGSLLGKGAIARPDSELSGRRTPSSECRRTPSECGVTPPRTGRPAGTVSGGTRFKSATPSTVEEGTLGGNRLGEQYVPPEEKPEPDEENSQIRRSDTERTLICGNGGYCPPQGLGRPNFTLPAGRP